MGRELSIRFDEDRHVVRRTTEPPFHGGERDLHAFGDLFELEALHVAQHEHGAIVHAELLQEGVKAHQELTRLAVHAAHGQIGKAPRVGEAQNAAYASPAQLPFERPQGDRIDEAPQGIGVARSGDFLASASLTNVTYPPGPAPAWVIESVPRITAMPKSATLHWPSGVTSTFWDLMSR